MHTNQDTITAELEKIDALRNAPKSIEKVIFDVRGLYGTSKSTITLPLGEGKSIDSGPLSLTIDPESSQNVGLIEFNEKKLTVIYHAQIVFPGLYKLVTEGNYDLSLLTPLRATATDICTVSDDMTGWHATGCLSVLPGSLWSGTEGG